MQLIISVRLSGGALPRLHDRHHCNTPCPCRERSEKQRLRKEVRREQRGAVRELRKDAAFLHSVREHEKAAAQAERRSHLRAGMSFMQQQAGPASLGRMLHAGLDKGATALEAWQLRLWGSWKTGARAAWCSRL